MSRQIRTWEEGVDEATGRPRWDVLINGRPVPGGYVVQTGSGEFEAHYPHVAAFTRPTLAEAKERLEWAPPVTSGMARIASPVEDDEEGFVSTEEAARALGVSVYRVNAMVADGKLAARRAADGSAEVSRGSLAKLASSKAPAAAGAR